MHKPTTARQWGQLVTGLVLLAIALTATGLSLYINVSYGSQIGTAAAIASGLSDAALAIIPIVGVAIGWSRQLRAAFIVCALYSVWTASNYMADHYGQHFVSKQHEASEHLVLKDRTRSLQAKLDQITEQGTVKSLTGQVELKAAQAQRESQRGGCGPKCEALKDQEAQLRARLGLAQRRDKLAADLAAARTKLANTPPVEVSGLATHAASLTKLDENTIAQIIGAASVVFVLILIELLRHLNGPAAHMLKLATRKPRKRNQQQAPPAPPTHNVIPLHRERAERGLRSLTGT
jgi:hypothetical protein